MSRALAAAVLVALAGVPAALAGPATGGEVRRLAADASRGDTEALERLRRVDRVDGRPADVRAALDADAAELRSRLRVLAAGGSPAAPGAADARREAERILAQRRFQGSSVPRPLHGVLEWLGQKLRVLARPLEWLADRLPGGRPTLWVVLSALVVAAAALVAVRLAARRSARVVQFGPGGDRTRDLDPGRLERDAADAERRGELERALRLRFRAGLARLARADVIPARDSLTSATLRDLVGSPAFDRLALDVDEVVYGGRPASPDDVGRSREAWPRVLQEARRG